MLAFVMASTLAAATADPPLEADRKKQPVRHCRAIVEGSSRTGDVMICRTKAQWRRREMCQGATRYCPPSQRGTLPGKPAAFALSENSRIVCRTLIATGSRLYHHRVCLPQREWQRLWDEGSATTADMQDKSMRDSEFPK